VPFASGVFLQLLIEELRTPPNFHLWEMPYTYTMLLHDAHASNLDEKTTQNSSLRARMCLLRAKKNDVPLNFGSEKPQN